MTNSHASSILAVSTETKEPILVVGSFVLMARIELGKGRETGVSRGGNIKTEGF